MKYATFPLIALLAALTSITPLAIDMYLGAMPDIAVDFHASLGDVEMSISLFLLGFALGQLIGGILSDRLGRKKSALIGLSGFVLANFALALAPSLLFFDLFRLLQALSGGIAIVNSAATVRDLFHAKEAAKIFSMIASITMIAPMIAPTLGTLIVYYSSWEMIFFLLGLYALVVAMAIGRFFPTYPFTPSSQSIRASYTRVLTHTHARRYIITLAFSFGGMFLFIQKSSAVYMEYFHLSSHLFPLFFGVNVAMMILLTRTNIALLRHYHPRVILALGVWLQLGAGVALLLLPHTLEFVFVGIVLYVGVLGLIFGNAMALTLEFFAHESGVANAIIGVSEFTLAGLIGIMSAHFDSLDALFLLMVSSSLIAFIALKR